MKTLKFWLALLLLFPSPALAWSEYGHRTIASIAMANVKPATRTRIIALLRHSPELATPECPIRTLQDASVWADCIRSIRPRFDYMAPWHFQNLDICKPFDIKSECANGNCVTAQVDRTAKLLADRKMPSWVRVEALAELVHFVSDMHQPLHMGGRDDRGGNDTKAAWGIYMTDRLNLHSIWDWALAERSLTTPPMLVRRYSAEEMQAEGGGTVAEWAEQSWRLARDSVYATALDGDPCGAMPKERLVIDEDDVAKLVPVVQRQVKRAGLRLALMLDEALK